MPQEAVFYFDVLGFRQMAAGTAEDAVDALSDLAALLQHENLFPSAKKWTHRYALGDSVFLTHAHPAVAIKQASDLVFNLFQLNLGKPTPFLVRGAVAYGEVHHVRGVFLTTGEPANLVGHAVVEAVTLEQASGLRGPRILLSESLARGVDAALRDWLLRPTSTARSEEHTSELQSLAYLVCRLLLEKTKAPAPTSAQCQQTSQPPTPT